MVLLEFSMTPSTKEESKSPYVARILDVIDKSGLTYQLTPMGGRRAKAALSCGCKSHLATAPASSNRSGCGGNDMAEAFG